MLDRFAALLGAIPPFLMLWYAEHFERRIKEPHVNWRYRVLAAAGLASIPMAWAESVVSEIIANAGDPQRTLFEAYIVAASVEETGKVACLYLLTRLSLGPRTRYGSFLYALHAAAGFAVVENVMVMLHVPNFTVFTVRFVLRAYMASPMHMMAGGIVGYLWARRRFDNGAVGLSGGLALAILTHGTYNALLLGVERLPVSYPRLVIVCAAIAIALPLCGIIMLRVMAGKLRAADERAGRGAERTSRAPTGAR